MMEEAKNYDVYETARVLGLSPARVRQMLRAGELEGERREESAEGVPGPWKVRAYSVRNLVEAQQTGLGAGEADSAADDCDPTSPSSKP